MVIEILHGELGIPRFHQDPLPRLPLVLQFLVELLPLAAHLKQPKKHGPVEAVPVRPGPPDFREGLADRVHFGGVNRVGGVEREEGRTQGEWVGGDEGRGGCYLRNLLSDLLLAWK